MTDGTSSSPRSAAGRAAASAPAIEGGEAARGHVASAPVRPRHAFDPGPLAATIIVLVALTFFWYFASIAGASDEMSETEAWFIPLFMLGMLSVQATMLVAASWLGRRLLGSDLPLRLLGAAVLAANFFSNFLGNLRLFNIQGEWVQAVVLVVAFGFAFILVSEVHQSRGTRLAIVAICVLLLAGQVLFDALFEVGEISR